MNFLNSPQAQLQSLLIEANNNNNNKTPPQIHLVSSLPNPTLKIYQRAPRRSRTQQKCWLTFSVVVVLLLHPQQHLQQQQQILPRLANRLPCNQHHHNNHNLYRFYRQQRTKISLPFRAKVCPIVWPRVPTLRLRHFTSQEEHNNRHSLTPPPPTKWWKDIIERQVARVAPISVLVRWLELRVCFKKNFQNNFFSSSMKNILNSIPNTIRVLFLREKIVVVLSKIRQIKFSPYPPNFVSAKISYPIKVIYVGS